MRNRWKIATLVLGLVLSYSVFTALRGGATGSATTVQAPRVGALAPDFTLSDMNGKAISLSQFRGKVVMLNFWATWCPPCRAEMPSIENLYRQLNKSGNFVLLAVNVEENARDSIKEFSSRSSLSFPILLDSKGQAANLYQVNGIPQTYLIDQKGVIVQKVDGGREWDSPRIVAYLSSLVKGERAHD